MAGPPGIYRVLGGSHIVQCNYYHLASFGSLMVSGNSETHQGLYK